MDTNYVPVYIDNTNDYDSSIYKIPIINNTIDTNNNFDNIENNLPEKYKTLSILFIIMFLICLCISSYFIYMVNTPNYKNITN